MYLNFLEIFKSFIQTQGKCILRIMQQDKANLFNTIAQKEKKNDKITFLVSHFISNFEFGPPVN